MKDLSFEFSRRPRFEMAKVTASEQGVSTSTAIREEPRTMVGTVLGALREGEQVLMMAGGDNDVPTVFARSPYVF